MKKYLYHKSYTIKGLNSFLIVITICLFGYAKAYTQGINPASATNAASAILDLDATDQGILVPRLTVDQRNAIPSPANGLLIYNVVTNKFNYYKGTSPTGNWYEIKSSSVYVTSGGSVNPGGGVAINATSAQPNNSAILDIDNASRGFLIPRMATVTGVTGVTGLIIYNNTDNVLNYFTGSGWRVPCATTTGATGATGSQTNIGAAINTDNSDPDQSAILDVKSNTKGILIPRLTSAQRNDLKPVQGLTIYNTDNNTIEYYYGTTGWYGFDISPYITIQPSSPASICAGGSATITGLAATGGTSYKWQYYNVSSWEDVVGGHPTGSTYSNQTTSSLTVAGISSAGSYQYQCVVSTSGCSSMTSNAVTVTVNALPANKTIAAAASSVCSGSATNITVELSLATETYQLRNNTGNANIGSAVTGNGGTINLPTGNLTAATTFNVLATITSSSCTAQMSVTPTVSVDATSVGGTATPAASPISNGSSTTITVADYTGTIQWQQSADGSTGWATVTGGSGATTVTYTTPNLTTTTYYRAVVTNGNCPSANSTTATVTVNAACAVLTAHPTYGGVIFKCPVNNDGTGRVASTLTYSLSVSAGVTQCAALGSGWTLPTIADLDAMDAVLLGQTLPAGVETFYDGCYDARRYWSSEAYDGTKQYYRGKYLTSYCWYLQFALMTTANKIRCVHSF